MTFIYYWLTRRPSLRRSDLSILSRVPTPVISKFEVSLHYPVFLNVRIFFFLRGSFIRDPIVYRVLPAPFIWF